MKESGQDIVKRLENSISDKNIKIRRNLLAASVIGFLFSKVGLVPTKFSTLGIEFSISNQNTLFSFLCFIILYYSFQFFVAILTQLEIWHTQLIYNKSINQTDRYNPFSTSFLIKMQILIEYLVPLIIGIYSLASLFTMILINDKKIPNNVEITPKTEIFIEKSNESLKAVKSRLDNIESSIKEMNKLNTKTRIINTNNDLIIVDKLESSTKSIG